MSRIAKCLVALAGAALLSSPALAQNTWPTEPVKLIVAYPPGGSTDTAARLVAQRLSETLGQQVVVENRPGAGGTIGAASVTRAKPDGHTVLFAASPEVTIATVVRKDLTYNPQTDLRPVTLVGRVPFMLVTNPDLPAKTLEELINYGKQNPGKLNYSSFGINTSNHLIGEQFKILTGITATHVPYKGSGPSLTDLMGGQVQYSFDTITAALGFVKAGRLHAIAVALPERLAHEPDIPTMSEAGLPGFVGGTWFGMLVPANTPDYVIEKLNAETRAALETAEIKQKFSELTILPSANSPQEFRDFMDGEIATWKKVTSQFDVIKND